MSHAWDNLECTVEIFISFWEQLPQTDYAQSHVPNSVILLSELQNQIIQEQHPEDESPFIKQCTRRMDGFVKPECCL